MPWFMKPGAAPREARGTSPRQASKDAKVIAELRDEVQRLKSELVRMTGGEWETFEIGQMVRTKFPDRAAFDEAMNSLDSGSDSAPGTPSALGTQGGAPVLNVDAWRRSQLGS